MFKIVYCVRRKPGMSVAEFQDYWLHTHGPLVRQHAAALNIRRYIQTHTVHQGLTEAMVKSRNGPEPFDGIAELWYDSEADVFDRDDPVPFFLQSDHIGNATLFLAANMGRFVTGEVLVVDGGVTLRGPERDT